MSTNAKLAAIALKTTEVLGVQNYVICAGARNSHLIAHLDTIENAQLWNHFDERAAAFFALGLSKATGQPVAIVTTSGTAVAELLPAVIEAWYSAIPLILITADRPSHFRGSGAPQAIEQVGIFTSYVGQTVDLESLEDLPEIQWDKKSPLHINVCFEDPTTARPTEAEPLEIASLTEVKTPKPIEVPEVGTPIAIVGELRDKSAVAEFLIQSKLPVWIEAQSGLREHPDLIDQQIYSEAEIGKIEPTEVIRIGGVPCLRFWRDLETRNGTKVYNFTENGFPGLARTTNVENYPISCLFSRLYSVQSRTVHCTVPNLLAKHPKSEPSLVHDLSTKIPEAAAVFLGNSMPIREWNLAATRKVPHPNCYANRGANGIDGEISTYLGISQNYTESWGIFGDLTTLYDLNALWIADQLKVGKRRIVILNNGGGRIFSRLPAMKHLQPKTLAMVENHHQIQFSAWAQMWGWEFRLWSDDSSNWQLPQTDRAIIEIAIDQAKSESFWEELKSIG